MVAQIDRNRVNTLAIGAGTVAVLLVLLVTFARLTGVGLPPRRVGALDG